MERDFPLEKVNCGDVKLKHAPIRFCWPHWGRSRSVDHLEGRNSVDSVDGHSWNFTRWFQLPPKVILVPGILGPHPSELPRDVNPRGGRGELQSDPESGHPAADLGIYI